MRLKMRAPELRRMRLAGSKIERMQTNYGLRLSPVNMRGDSAVHLL